MRQKLLGHLNSVFDKDPDAVPVIRLSHAGTALWKVEGRELTVSTRLFGSQSTFDLSSMTISELAENLGYAGFTATVANNAYLWRPADIIIEGSGDEGNGYNGNVLYAFRSDLWTILNTIGKTLEETHRNACVEGVNMAYFDRSSGYWLDVWGSFFGILRNEGQDDEGYLKAIIEEVMRPRNNHYAMRNAVEKITGRKVFIHEFWKDRYSIGGTQPLPENDDEVYCRFEVLCDDVLTELEKREVLSVIEATRPVGVLCEGFAKAVYNLHNDDIDFEPVFRYEIDDATWRINHEWKTGLDGNDARWDEQVYTGFNISMGLSQELFSISERAELLDYQTVTAVRAASASERPGGWSGRWSVESWLSIGGAKDSSTVVVHTTETAQPSDYAVASAAMVASGVGRPNGWMGLWSDGNWLSIGGAKDSSTVVEVVPETASASDMPSAEAARFAETTARPDGWTGNLNEENWTSTSGAKDSSQAMS